ncbi:threonine ammonia-lyase [Ekhidna sp.]|jgi:threonine dehydratase|uniref:threonine ammonia-lyase n=1 Tax=Ekhidna sp. TaxID=2608089 RepID=UPI0032EC4B7D
MQVSQRYHPSVEKVREAASSIREVVSFTPLMPNLHLSSVFGAHIQMKREDLQLVRSYKIRGALNKMKSLSASELQRGVVCASAGNHAQGVAHSCAILECKGVIYMPATTSRQKITQVKMFGKEFVDVRLEGDTFDDAKVHALIFAQTNNATFIHPFDDPEIIDGQATVALELLEQTNKPIDYLIIPVGGGGLAAGVGSVFKTLSPNTRIIGVEPEGAPSMTTSLKEGKNVSLDSIDKFVDGAAVQKVGDLNFDICKKVIDEMVTVPEGKVCETILSLYNRDAIVVEPAGALALSALDQLSDEITSKNVVCIVSGSNNDITRTEEIKERALLYKGLKHYFVVRFPQRAGALKEFVAEILGPSDDITHFEYTKKNSRETGSAVVGIELKEKSNLDPLISRMKERKFFGEYLNHKEDLLNILI